MNKQQQQQQQQKHNENFGFPSKLREREITTLNMLMRKGIGLGDISRTQCHITLGCDML